MSYRTDDDRTDERIGALRDELARRRDTLDQLQRAHDQLTGEHAKRRAPVDALLHARTDEDRIALLVYAIDEAQANILALRRENEELQRVKQQQDCDAATSKAVAKSSWHVFKFLKKWL